LSRPPENVSVAKLKTEFFRRSIAFATSLRPNVAAEVRSLIRPMSLENSLWGAPRIHGELLKLGIEVAQPTVAKYMAKRCRPGSGHTWQTFLRNHLAAIGAMGAVHT
jgi:hypothetical protein